MKAWEGERPSEPPAVGQVLVARVRLGGRVKGLTRRVCIVTASGVYPPHPELPEGHPYAGPTPWAHGRWQRRDGSWSKPTRVLGKPWAEVQPELEP